MVGNGVEGVFAIEHSTHHHHAQQPGRRQHLRLPVPFRGPKDGPKRDQPAPRLRPTLATQKGAGGKRWGTGSEVAPMPRERRGPFATVIRGVTRRVVFASLGDVKRRAGPTRTGDPAKARAAPVPTSSCDGGKLAPADGVAVLKNVEEIHVCIENRCG